MASAWWPRAGFAEGDPARTSALILPSAFTTRATKSRSRCPSVVGREGRERGGDWPEMSRRRRRCRGWSARRDPQESRGKIFSAKAALKPIDHSGRKTGPPKEAPDATEIGLSPAGVGAGSMDAWAFLAIGGRCRSARTGNKEIIVHSICGTGQSRRSGPPLLSSSLPPALGFVLGAALAAAMLQLGWAKLPLRRCVRRAARRRNPALRAGLPPPRYWMGKIHRYFARRRPDAYGLILLGAAGSLGRPNVAERPVENRQGYNRGLNQHPHLES